MKQLFAVFFLAALVSIQGCGFHLRGKVDLAPVLANVYIKGKFSALNTQIAEMLSVAGSTRSPGEQGASAVLRIQEARFERTVSTVDTRGRATGYLLIYTARFDVADSTGRSLLKSQTVRVHRDYEFDAAQLLAAEGEEEFLRRDMERDAAQRIVRQLGSIPG